MFSNPINFQHVVVMFPKNKRLNNTKKFQEFVESFVFPKIKIVPEILPVLLDFPAFLSLFYV